MGTGEIKTAFILGMHGGYGNATLYLYMYNPYYTRIL